MAVCEIVSIEERIKFAFCKEEYKKQTSGILAREMKKRVRLRLYQKKQRVDKERED